jgi:hypothetical protein
MKNNFLKTACNLREKPTIRLFDSPLGTTYLALDDSFSHCMPLRLEAVKAFFRSYQTNKHLLEYRIIEVEHLLRLIPLQTCTSDQFFDLIYGQSIQDHGFAKFLLSTFSFLRGELQDLPQ